MPLCCYLHYTFQLLKYYEPNYLHQLPSSLLIYKKYSELNNNDNNKLNNHFYLFNRENNLRNKIHFKIVMNNVLILNKVKLSCSMLHYTKLQNIIKVNRVHFFNIKVAF